MHDIERAVMIYKHEELFSEYGNYLTGVEYCISLLHSQRVRSPALPPSD